MSRIIVVGAGINGVTAAIELKKRGHNVVLVDPGPLPHPFAASTDISKAVRAAYGADEDYTDLATRSIELWRKWNQEFGTQFYHEVGVMFVRRRELKPGDFEHESFKTLKRRGHKVERMNSARLWKRFPAWNPELYRDGVLELEAGYAESGRVVATLIERAKSLDIELREGVRFSQLHEEDYGVSEIALDGGKRIAGDFVVMAVGAWTPYLLPFTKKFFRASGQPVFHLKPRQPELFAPTEISGARCYSRRRKEFARVSIIHVPGAVQCADCLLARLHVLRYARWAFLDRARSGAPRINNCCGRLWAWV
ncbi:MAG: hypothetical protein DME71_07350 [Verrucomicrobia bacterium]|nr:MAG: hypothetical protein DME71_07350 [Verrucomicrobiota bacterium]